MTMKGDTMLARCLTTDSGQVQVGLSVQELRELLRQAGGRNLLQVEDDGCGFVELVLQPSEPVLKAEAAYEQTVVAAAKTQAKVQRRVAEAARRLQLAPGGGAGRDAGAADGEHCVCGAADRGEDRRRPGVGAAVREGWAARAVGVEGGYVRRVRR